MQNFSSLRLNFFSGKTESAQACEICQIKYGQSDLEKANVQVVLGGDGSVLQAFHQQIQKGINCPVFALNFGSKGWMTNEQSLENLPQRIMNAKVRSLTPLQMTATMEKDGQKKVLYSYNEICALRASPQALHMSVLIKDDSKTEQLYLEGDGGLIATPLGSHAYYEAIGGKPVDLSERALLFHSINSKNIVDMNLTHRAQFAIQKYQGEKRPLMIEGDGQRLTGVSRAVVKLAPHMTKALLFDAYSKKIR